VLETSDRIVVMRDGKVVAADVRAAFDRDKLVSVMGAAGPRARSEGDTASQTRSAAPIRVRARPERQQDGLELIAREGEIIGLAGLSGHGQTELLLEIFNSASPRNPRTKLTAAVAFVAGDRQSNGIFPLWSIAENIAIRSISRLRNGILISPARENEFAAAWQRKMDIRTPDIRHNILSLSGGNQQKALFARAFGSDAEVVLMDDPMRGVDIGTKLEVYEMIREEARAGRTFLWYTTETDELQHCDHTYVFRNGRIVADLARGDLTEEKVIQSSFQAAG
jgi:ribose transport system ATP-binding protein